MTPGLPEEVRQALEVLPQNLMPGAASPLAELRAITERLTRQAEAVTLLTWHQDHARALKGARFRVEVDMGYLSYDFDCVHWEAGDPAGKALKDARTSLDVLVAALMAGLAGDEGGISASILTNMNALEWPMDRFTGMLRLSVARRIEGGEAWLDAYLAAAQEAELEKHVAPGICAPGPRI